MSETQTSKAGAFGASHAQRYAEAARRQVPGLDGLHAMSAQLLGERVPEDGRVLVLGAGGGLELTALAQRHSGWRFEGVDPSPDMLAAAREAVADHAGRIKLVQGYIEDASDGPFDGAVCLLTFHFLAREVREATLRAIHHRLAPGAPLVIAHISFEQSEPARSRWIARHVTFGGAHGANAEAAREAIGSRLSVLSPPEDEAMLADAGFTGVNLFYAGMSVRGWVGYA